MNIDHIVNLALKGDYNSMMDELEKLHPRKMMEFDKKMRNATKGIEFNEDADDYLDNFRFVLSTEQYKRWKWLCGTDRERDYLMSIPEDEITDQDWSDLRATDF